MLTSPVVLPLPPLLSLRLDSTLGALFVGAFCVESPLSHSQSSLTAEIVVAVCVQPCMKSVQLIYELFIARLYGVTTIQTYIYFHGSQRDSGFMKRTVGLSDTFVV